MDALMHSELRRIFPSSFVDLRSEILRQVREIIFLFLFLPGFADLARPTGLVDALSHGGVFKG